jgi:hypothetical protein
MDALYQFSGNDSIVIAIAIGTHIQLEEYLKTKRYMRTRIDALE